MSKQPFFRRRHLRLYLTSWNLGLTFKNGSLPMYRKREVTFIHLPHGDFLATWDFPVSVIHSSIYPTEHLVYHGVLGAWKWIKSISTLRKFIVWWKDRLKPAIIEMKIRILCVASFFKGLLSNCKVLKYILNK